ncbi:deoxycytidylate deaminase [Streptomyces sp. NPDC001513]|uniref:deoxycytidylate deaminase n=1 Tax=Streptomyces sp. NPDC001513 TaxID=3364580 RepID=UPI0036CC8E26
MHGLGSSSVASRRLSWDEYFLNGARWVATRADCTRAQVGAVLVNANHEVRGTGYNGAPAGVPGCASTGSCPRGQHARTRRPFEDWKCTCGESWPCPNASEPDSDYSNCIADHAERNAIEHTPPNELPGSTLYVTREPCPQCWTLILASGIARVVTPGRAYKRG